MTEGHFLYYLPGKAKGSVTRADLAANPILSAPLFEFIHSPRLFNTKLHQNEIMNRGPDNGSGCLLHAQPQVECGQIPGYYPDRQKWQKFGDVWIGWEPGMLPGPESLRRATQITGYEVELGDGRIWNAPVVKPFHEAERTLGCNLPMIIGVDETMSHTAAIVNRFRWAWDLSGKIADRVFNGATDTRFGSFDDAVAMLSLNYRVGTAEATILELFDDDTVSEVLLSAVDNRTVQEFLERGQQNQNP